MLIQARPIAGARRTPARRIAPRSRRLTQDALIAIAAVGCGSADPNRLPVAGTVTVDGRPLDAGTITFLPVEGGPPASVTIEAGTFAIDAGSGPGSGPCQVEVVAIQPTGRTIPSPDDPAAIIEEVHNVIPARYNIRTELSVQVTDPATNEFQFALSSRDEPTRATVPGRFRR
jgi:hypothetical protein